MPRLSVIPVLFAGAGLAAGGAAAAADRLAGPVAAEVLRVIDGDTIEVAAQIWIGQRVTVAVRLEGVDAPEIFRPACDAERAHGQAAKARAETFFVGGAATLHGVHNGKYAGRVVAAMRNSAGADLGETLVTEGLATRGARDWCAVG